MAEYKIGEFRANIKKAFDEAARGESVCIDRYGDDFYLISKKDWNDTVLLAQQGFATIITDEVSVPLIPEINAIIGMQPEEITGMTLPTIRTMQQARDLTKKNIHVSPSEQKD